MKKIVTLIGCFTLAASLQTKAQSQRLVLIEEFTNASCGPCAAQNPAFNTLLDNNLVKAISIKYQTNWPGVDPMNAQTQTDVAPRVTYYSVTGVPYSPMDGVAFTGGSYVGAPANATQAKINAAYAVPATHDISLTHSFNTVHDSVFITMNITCTQTATGTLKARIGLVEKEINFASAPGTNGETEFYYIMRKMYPNATGTVVTANTLAQVQTITIAAALPSFTYNINQMAVVAFIQNDVNKSINQAAFSDVVYPSNMALVQDVLNVNRIQCTGVNVNPEIAVINKGSATLTNCTIKYKFDNGVETVVPWTCNIPTDSIQNFTIPQITTTSGAHTIKATVTAPNGVIYALPYVSSLTEKIQIIDSYNIVPVAENFSAAAWPPANWFTISDDAIQSWVRKTAIGAPGSTIASAKMTFYSSPNGQVDDLFITPMDLTAAVAPATLDFMVAYRQYSATVADQLAVRVSTDCGATWTQEFLKAGAALSTVAGYLATAFTPLTSQWRAETINMDAYIGQPEVLVQFHAISASGNNAYVDDVNFYDGTLGIKNVRSSNTVFSAYQSSENYMKIQLNLEQTNEVTFEVYNILGKKVYAENKGKLASGEQNFAYGISALSSGVYIVKLTAGSIVYNQKVTINK